MAAHTLYRLADTWLTFENPDEDIRGRRVLDGNGEEVGTVDDLIVDTRTNAVPLLEVTNGGFLGFGGTRFLVMTGDIEFITPRAVHLKRAGERTAGETYAPALRELPPDERVGEPPLVG